MTSPVTDQGDDGTFSPPRNITKTSPRSLDKVVKSKAKEKEKKKQELSGSKGIASPPRKKPNNLTNYYGFLPNYSLVDPDDMSISPPKLKENDRAKEKDLQKAKATPLPKVATDELNKEPPKENQAEKGNKQKFVRRQELVDTSSSGEEEDDIDEQPTKARKVPDLDSQSESSESDTAMEIESTSEEKNNENNTCTKNQKNTKTKTTKNKKKSEKVGNITVAKSKAAISSPSALRNPSYMAKIFAQANGRRR